MRDPVWELGQHHCTHDFQVQWTWITISRALLDRPPFFPGGEKRTRLSTRKSNWTNMSLRWSLRSTLATSSQQVEYHWNNKQSLLFGQDCHACFLSQGVFPGVLLKLKFKRKLSYHMLRTYLPSFLFVTLAWFSMFIPVEHVPGEVAGTERVRSLIAHTLLQQEGWRWAWPPCWPWPPCLAPSPLSRLQSPTPPSWMSGWSAALSLSLPPWPSSQWSFF